MSELTPLDIAVEFIKGIASLDVNLHPDDVLALREKACGVLIDIYEAEIEIEGKP